MVKEKQKKNKRIIVKTLVFAILVAIIAGIIWLLTNQREEYTSTNIKKEESSFLNCKASYLPEGEGLVLKPKEAESSNYMIKMLFEEEKLNSIAYNFDGSYETKEKAENVMAILHADYNKYMGSNGLSTETLNPIFTHNENRVKVSFYAERKNLNLIVAPIFLIDKDEYGGMTEFSLENLKALYEGKGFSCVDYE